MSLFRKIAAFLFRLGRKKRREGISNKVLNLQKDAEDARDHKLTYEMPAQPPPTRTLRQFTPAVKQQGSIGSCGSMAIVSAYETLLNEFKPDAYITGSELAHYWIVRSIEYENTLPRDAGQTLRNGMKAIQKVGMVPESLCPYDVTKYNEEPSVLARSFGRWWKPVEYQRCETTDDMVKAIASGQPVILGISVWREFLTNTDGVIKMPEGAQIIGGHAILLISYDLKNKEFEFLNSWGREWAAGGYATIPFSIVENLVIDAWTMKV